MDAGGVKDKGAHVDLRKCGLWASVVRNGDINPNAWRGAAATGEVIGTCRSCGGYMVPDDPPDTGERMRVTWYVARCIECGHECAAPDGRLLRWSGRAGERAGGQ